jgi:hypothetical protein
MLKQRRALWILLAVLVLAAGIGAAGLKKIKPAPVADTPAVLEFLPSDVMTLQARELRQLLPLSTLNLFSIIGFIMLMGLVTKNAILLVDFANHRS